jgi:hypothetical protein
MVLDKIRGNFLKIGGVLVILLVIGGVLFVGSGPITDLIGTDEKPTPNATATFEKQFEGDNINVEVVFTNDSKAEKLVVKKVGSSMKNKTIHRVNSHVTFMNLQHGDTLKAYAVFQNQWKEIGNYTVYVNRNPQATISYEQTYDSQTETYTVTATLEQAPAIDYITAVSTGTFTSSSGDSRDYDGDGNTNDDINIIQKQLQIEGISSGSSVIIVGKVDGKYGIVDSYTVTERPEPPEPP